MRSYSHINSANRIISEYPGRMPFAIWLKAFFRDHKKYGSSDRRAITQLCYCYFRTAHALGPLPAEERMLSALFLCSGKPHPILQDLNPELNAAVSQNIDEKLLLLGLNPITHFFPLLQRVSPKIDRALFDRSHIVQPSLFLRARPGKLSEVTSALRDAEIVYETHRDCIEMENNTRVESIIALDRDAVIQDRSSQKTLDLLLQLEVAAGIRTVWDCCAASGGKSILATDKLDEIQLTVSDIRESILINLRNRFRRAEIVHYDMLQLDLNRAPLPDQKKFDLIICDAPCSGSGTWGRTPEQLVYFTEEEISRYTSLQKQIVMNAMKSLKKDGLLLYITCSVFAAENEENCAYIVSHSALEMISSTYLPGFEHRADTLFSAVFRNARSQM